MAAKYKLNMMEAANAKVLAELLTAPDTPESKRVDIINKLLEAKEQDSFFKLMFEEELSFGSCPCCGHENHWAIPEDDLNQMGWSTPDTDPECDKYPDRETCPEFQEAHYKKKISI